MSPHPPAPRPTSPPGAATFPVAALERRFTAFVVDRALGWGLVVVAAVVTASLVDDAWVVVAVGGAVAVLLWLVLAVVLGAGGTSPGKALTGLRVVHHGTGTPIGVGPALLRSLVLGVAGVPTFGIGVATLAWTAVEDRGRQRRGWHDHLTGTVVVDVRPVEVEVPVAAADTPRHIVNLTAMRLVPAPPVEDLRTPERTEQSMRRQVLPPEVARGPIAPIPAGPPHAAPPPQPQPQPQPQRWRVHLDDGETFVVAGLALVGRRPEARAGEQVAHLVPLASADMSVSKTHAQFGPAPDGTMVVMDRGSTNGTLLVRQGVSRQLQPGRPTTLVDGDRVVWGDREMTIRREA